MGASSLFLRHTCVTPRSLQGSAKRRYLPGPEAKALLSQLGLVPGQRLLGSLVLRIEEQEAQDVFHSLRQIPHWRWRDREEQ